MRLLPAAAVCLSLLSCTILESETDFVITLPEAPRHWRAAFPDLRYLIVAPDSGGVMHGLIVAATEERIVVSCSRRGNSPVFAWPLTCRETTPGESGPLRPAGGLFPLSLDAAAESPTLTLTWEEGSLAYVMARLLEAGRDTSLFNAERLAGYLADKDDPWTVDLDAVAQSAVDGGFSAYDIDEKESRDISVTPGTGTWFLESPFASTVDADEDGCVTLVGITIGTHALHATDGRLVRIEVGTQEVTVKEVP